MLPLSFESISAFFVEGILHNYNTHCKHFIGLT